jgi:hypothetical protein
MSAAHPKPLSFPPPHPAIDYLQATFAPEDHIFFFGVHSWKKHPDKNGKPVPDVKTYPLMPLAVATTLKQIEKLEKDEANDWNIYVSMNPFPPGSPSRIEKLVKTIRNVYIETDGSGDVLQSIAIAVEDNVIPAPHSIVESSPGKHHIVWHVEGIAPDEAKALNRALATRFGGDIASVDAHRLLRMPGFKNLKYPDKPVCKLIEKINGDGPYSREQFKIETVTLKADGAPLSEGVLANIISRFEQNAKEASFEPGSREDDLNGYRWDITCPWSDSHTTGGSDAILMVLKDGRPEFSCLHNHCAQRGWSDIRQIWESRAGHKQKFAVAKDLQAMILNREGEVKPLIANAITMLKTTPCWEGVLAYNLLTMSPVKLKAAPWEECAGTAWTDHDDTKLVEFFQHNGLYINSSKQAGEVANAAARENSFHPVHDYLEPLRWDSVARLDKWLHTYLGTKKDEYTRAVGRCWMISAVANVYRPGCKVDYVLTLEGDQGTLKSSALSALASDEFFLDDFADFDDKDDKLKLHGAWIVELAELTGMRRDINKVKAFITCKDDVFRSPYDKRPQHHPRMNVFAASTNDNTPFTDETGSRRFWPVKCGVIDISKLRADRDQLWAEAVSLFKKGEEWWFEDKALDELAAEEQRKRYQFGQWDETIERWLAAPRQRTYEKNEIGEDGKPLPPKICYVTPWDSSPDEVTVDDILLHAIEKPLERRAHADVLSVVKCLKHNHWERVSVREAGDVRKFYRRPGVSTHDRNKD